MKNLVRVATLMALAGAVGGGLSACASSSSAPAGAAGTAGTSGGAGTGATGAAGTTAACQVNILPISPASFDGLVAGTDARVRVRGELTGSVSAVADWTWAVTLADGSPVPVTTIDDDPSLVEFPLATVGTFTIAVTLTPAASGCVGLRTITAARPGGRIAAFRFHVTPTAKEDLPPQDFERQITGGTPSGGNVLALDPGFKVALSVNRNDQTLPSYVRLTDAVSGAVFETRTSAGGANTVRVATGSYDMLVVPDGDVAPAVYPARPAQDIAAAAVNLDDGPMVAGTVSDAGGQPVAGATVVLRAGALVSTTGTTDATGAFHVHARAGTFGVTVVSTLADGPLEATLAATNGIVVDATTPPAALAVKLQPGPLFDAAVALSAHDAASLGPAMRVTLSTIDPLDAVATLTLGTAAPRPMAGAVSLTLHPNTDGTLTTGGLPRGRYLLTVFPAVSGLHDGVTTTTLDLRAGSLGPLALPLAQKVLLQGTLLPKDVAAGVHLVALDDGGLPIVAEGDAAAGGVFSISVSPERSYALRAVPRPDQALARMTFPDVSVRDVDVVVMDRNMPAALLYAGRVVNPSLQGVGTSIVQAFCEASSPGCTHPATPVAETVTQSDGTFQLMLPDPDDGTP